MDDAGNLETAVSTPIFVKNSSSGSSQVAPVISPSLSSVSSWEKLLSLSFMLSSTSLPTNSPASLSLAKPLYSEFGKPST